MGFKRRQVASLQMKRRRRLMNTWARKRKGDFSGGSRKKMRRMKTTMYQPVPNKSLKKLYYTVSSGATANSIGTVPLTAVYQMRINSIYAPDYTAGVGGHQPLWHDQLSQLYAKYRVHGVKYKISLCNTTDNRLAQVGIVPAPNTAGESKWSTMAERRETRIVDVPPAGAGVRKISGFIRTGTAFGLTPRQMKEDEDFIAYFGYNPTKTAIMSLYFGSNVGTTTIDFKIDLIYYVELLERVKVGGS